MAEHPSPDAVVKNVPTISTISPALTRSAARLKTIRKPETQISPLKRLSEQGEQEQVLSQHTIVSPPVINLTTETIDPDELIFPDPNIQTETEAVNSRITVEDEEDNAIAAGYPDDGGFQSTGIQISRRDIPSYDGVIHTKGKYSTSIAEFLETMEELAIPNKWTEEVKMSMTLSAVEGRVKTHLRRWKIDCERNDEEMTWKKMKETLIQRESNAPLMMQKRIKYMSLKQAGRSLHDYILELEELGQLLSADSNSLLLTFQQGLDSDYQTFLLLQENPSTTFSEAVQRCEVFEATKTFAPVTSNIKESGMKKDKRKMLCNICKRTNHTEEEYRHKDTKSPPAQVQQSTGVWCTEHKTKSHPSEGCYTLHPELRPKFQEKGDFKGPQIKKEPPTTGKYCSFHKSTTHTTDECSLNAKNRKTQPPIQTQRPEEKEQPRNNNCYRCNQPGHRIAECTNPRVSLSHATVYPVFQQNETQLQGPPPQQVWQQMSPPPLQQGQMVQQQMRLQPQCQQHPQQQYQPRLYPQQGTPQLNNHNVPMPLPQAQTEPRFTANIASVNSSNYNDPCPVCKLRGHNQEQCVVLQQQLRQAEGNILAAYSSAKRPKPIMKFQLANGKQMTAMVDSGAVKTLLPQPLLSKLGVTLIKQKLPTFRGASGNTIQTLGITNLVLAIEGIQYPTQAIVIKGGIAIPLLGQDIIEQNEWSIGFLKNQWVLRSKDGMILAHSIECYTHNYINAISDVAPQRVDTEYVTTGIYPELIPTPVVGAVVEKYHPDREVYFTTEWMDKQTERFTAINLPESTLEPMTITLRDGEEIGKNKPYPMNPQKEIACKTKIADMVAKGHLRPSDNERCTVHTQTSEGC